MKKKYHFKALFPVIVTFFIILLCIQCSPEQGKFPVFSGPYLGQNPPGKTPEIFAPGIISTGLSERIAVFSPDGKEFYYCLWGAPFGIILCMKEINNRWSQPQVVSFSGKYPGEFTMSPDGNKIVFSSNQPFEGSPDTKEFWTWMVERKGTDWGEPWPLGPHVNMKRFAGYPSLAKSGNLYFYAERENGEGGDDIWVSNLKNGNYSQAENLGTSINTGNQEVDPFIAPDESYLLFCRISDKSQDADIFVSFLKQDGSWSQAVNLGTHINSSAWDYCPTVSPDGKYLFFTSTRTVHKNYSEKSLSYIEKIKILNSPGNGNSDIYWVDAEIILELRPESLKSPNSEKVGM